MAFIIQTTPNESAQSLGPIHLLADTAPYAAAETRTSSWILFSAASKVMGAAYADQAGTLLVQFSADGTSVDHQESISVTAATADAGFIVDCPLPWVRLSYTNGATESTVSRINLFGRSTS